MTAMTDLEAGKAALAEEMMNAALEAARAAPWPDASGAFTDVQDVGAPMPFEAERETMS